MTSAYDFEESLISEVRQSPTLYDHSRGEYREQIKVEDAWKAIASKLSASVRECKTRWKSLRDTYVRKIRSAQRNPTLFEEKKKWRYLDQMAFLDAFLKISLPSGMLLQPDTDSHPADVIVITARDDDDKTDNNSDMVPTSQDQNHSACKISVSRKRKQQVQTSPSPQSSSSTSPMSNDYDFKKLCHELMENKRVLDAYAAERDDEYFLFGRQVSLMLKRIGGLERYTAQIEIMEVLMARMPPSESAQ